MERFSTVCICYAPRWIFPAAHRRRRQLWFRLLGMGYPIGYAALIFEALGVRVNKTETLTNWRARPLAPRLAI